MRFGALSKSGALAVSSVNLHGKRILLFYVALWRRKGKTPSRPEHLESFPPPVVSLLLLRAIAPRFPPSMANPASESQRPAPPAACHRLLLSLRSHQRAWIAFLAAGLATLVVVRSKMYSNLLRQVATPLEQDDGWTSGLSDEEEWGEFPPLPPLEDRRRLWSPDLGASSSLRGSSCCPSLRGWTCWSSSSKHS